MTRSSSIARAERDIALRKLADRGQAVAGEPTPPYCLECGADLERDGELLRCKSQRCGRVLEEHVGSESGIVGRVVVEGSGER